VRKVAVVTSASGSGGTTVGRVLAQRLDVPFHELDAVFWKPDWVESTAEELHAAVEPIVATDPWVIDGSYQRKIGQLVLGNADVVVWLDLPMRAWLPRSGAITAVAVEGGRVSASDDLGIVVPELTSF
jgi:adenylate kinase family enzyme